MRRSGDCNLLLFHLLFLLLAWTQLAGMARALSGAGAIILQFDPSARASGMGLASTAVWWGEAPDYWANPALLGYHRGFRYEFTHHPLAQGLASDISFEAERATFGAFGIGVLSTGPRGYLLDLGWQVATDEQGNPIGTFHSWERARTWGVGLSLAGFLDGLFLDPDGRGDGIGRHFDLAAGVVEKEFEDMLAPDWALQEPGTGRAEAKNRDLGFLVRLSPVNTIGQTSERPGPARLLQDLLGGIRVDLSYGQSVLNERERTIVHVDLDQGDPMPKMHRRGVAARIATDLPGGLRDHLQARRLAWLADSFCPLLSWGYSWDEMTPGFRWDTHQASYVFERDESNQEKYEGWELSLANVYHVRRGWIRNPAGDIDGPTEGWGVGLRLGRFAGWRYDEATVPQARGLPRSWRRTWTVFLDGHALWCALHRR